MFDEGKRQRDDVYSNTNMSLSGRHGKINQMYFEGNYGMNGKIKRILSVTGTIVIVLTVLMAGLLLLSVLQQWFQWNYYDGGVFTLYWTVIYLICVVSGLAFGFLLHGLSKLIHNTDIMVELMKKEKE